MRRLPISWSDSFLARLGRRRKKSRRPYQCRRSLFEALEVRAMLSGTQDKGIPLARPEYVIVSEVRADNQPSDQFVVHTEYATNGTPQAVVTLRDGITQIDDTLHTLNIELQLGTSVLERQEVMIDIESQAFREQFLQDRLDRASADVTDVDNLTLQTLIDTLALQSQTGGPALPSGTEPNKITSEELGILAKNLRVKGQLDGGATTKVNLYTAIESKVQDVTADESTANTEADQAAIAEEGKQVGEAALLLADRVGRDLASENANVKAAAESLRDALIESGDLQYTVFAGLGTNQEVYRETTDQRQFVLGFVETGTYELTSHLRIELGSEQGVVQTTQLEGVSGSQAPLTTYIGEDTYVSEASPNSNYGSATELKVRNVAGSNEVALVAVNLAAEQGQVPSDAQVKLAAVTVGIDEIKHKVSAYYKTWAVSPKVFDEGATTWTSYTNSLAAGFREWAGNSFNNDSVIVAGVNSADITVAVQRALLLGDSNADGKVSVSSTYGPALGDVTRPSIRQCATGIRTWSFMGESAIRRWLWKTMNWSFAMMRTGTGKWTKTTSLRFSNA